MLSEIFYWVLNSSIIGGVTGLIVALLRRLPSFPRFAAYLLWLVPLCRLWIPFGAASRWSLLNLLSMVTTKTVVIWEGSHGFPDGTLSNFTQAAETYFPIVYKTAPLKRLFETAFVIWAVIAAAGILSSVFLYILTKRELRDARHLKENIWSSGKVTTPAVYGIFKPRILVPELTTDAELPYLLAHEQVHIRRRDNLWRVVAVVTACVHWFNPLCWLFLKWFFADMELACDIKALKSLGAGKEKDYASTLLSYAAGRTYFTSAFGGAKTKARIENILSYRKLTALSAIAFGALVISVSFVLVTNAMGG